MDIGSILSPRIPSLEANDKVSGMLMTMGEFYNYRARDRKLSKQDGDDYFLHQRIVRQYMVYNDNLMVIHDAGTGKTRTTLGFLHEIANGPLRNVYNKVVISTPSDLLHDNWKSNPEIEMYSDKLKIEYTTHSRLSRFNPKNYSGTFFVIDEAHLITGDSIDISFDRSDKETLRNIQESRGKDDIYKGIWNILHNTPLRKVLLLTATPMQNSQEDFYSLINLILPPEDQIMGYNEKIPEERMLNLLSGRVSYVRSAEEGFDIRYGLSPAMLEAINTSRLLNDVGKINLGYLFDINLERKYYIPGCTNMPHTHLCLELFSGEVREMILVIDINKKSVVSSDREDWQTLLEMEIGMEDGRVFVIFSKVNTPNNIPLPDIDFVFSLPSCLNNKLRPRDDYEVDVVETILSASQTLYFTSRLDEIRNKPLEEKGLSLSNNRLIVIDDPKEGLTPEIMYHVSNLFMNIIMVFLLSLSEEAREGKIRRAWLDLIGNEVVERGKNILFCEYVEISVGGIEKLGELMNRVGYTPFKYSDNYKSDIVSYGKAPRYIINPSPLEIEMFNHPENWDGSYIQVSLYSSQGAKGVSYFDVRHIHLIPHWSPSENTQALFRGIRAKSHDNIRSRLPEGEPFEVRIYKHVSTPMLSLLTYNNRWIVDGVRVSPWMRYFGEIEDQEAYIPTSQLPSTISEIIKYETELNRYTRILAKEISEGGQIADPFTDFQFTINGFAMEYVPDPTTHPLTNINGSNLRLPPREGYPTDVNETFYSPIAYKLTLATRKDIDISKMRMLYKQAAMDCDLNRVRNILPETMDNTEWCDYTSCNYQCLPEARGLEIVIDTIDPGTGEDVRWERNPWAPLSESRLSVGDVYTSLTPNLQNRVREYIVQRINNNPLGYIQIYNLLYGLRERFGTLISEQQLLSFISRMVYSNESNQYILDRYKNRCVLKTQGSIVYLCPLYTSERKLFFTPEGQTASRFLQGSSQKLFSNQESWEKISNPPPSADNLKREYETFLAGVPTGEDVVESCFKLATDFEKFVRVIEGGFIVSLEGGVPNDISRRFSKYFMKTTLDVIDKTLDSQGNLVNPLVSPWKMDNKKNITIHFHLLFNMHPSFSKVKKPISENTPIKILIETDLGLGFIQTTPIEQSILFKIAEEADKRLLFELSDKSRRDGREGVIGIIDDKKFIDPSGKNKLEYFKIYVPLTGKVSPKHPQGKVCITYSDDDLKKLASTFGVEVGKNKIENCKNLYDTFKNENRLR